MSCLFCGMVEKRIPTTIVHEDEHVLAFRDIKPVAPTHILVVPKKHVPGVRHLKDGDVDLIGRVVVAATKIAEAEGLNADGYRLVVNDGDAAGQTVHHIHVHVLGGRSLAWPPG